MDYIQYSIGQIKGAFKDYTERLELIQRAKDHNASRKESEPQMEIPASINPVVLRVETASGSPEPRLLQALGVGDDYFIARGRHKKEPETFSFHHITNWRFGEYVESEWR